MSETNHIVAISGGKDSVAMALRLAEVEPRDYTYVCTPTGNEPPAMFAHWLRLGELLGKKILPVMNLEVGGLDGVIRQQKTIPNHRMRFCTRILKIEPYREWLAAHAPAVSYVGLRADEEGRAGGAYGDLRGVEMRFPMREWGWGLADVLSYLEQRGVSIPERTDCMWCFHQRLGEWWLLWRQNLAAFLEAEHIEAEMGHTFRSPSRDSWPAALSDLRHRFEAGEIPPRTNLEPDLFRNIGQCRVCTL